MKKLLVLLLALTMVVGAVSAQATVKGFGYGQTSIADDGTTAYWARLRLNFSWKSEDGAASFGARLQSSFANNDNGYLALDSAPIKYMYGRLNLLDGKVQVDGGRLFITDWDVCSGISDWYLGNVENYAYTFDTTSVNAVFFYVNGLSVQVKPIEGMSIGVVFAPDADDDLGLEDFNAGFLYTIEGVGDIKASAEFGAELDTGSYLYGSFTYTGMENLSATLGYMGLTGTENKIYALVDYAGEKYEVNVAPMYGFDSEDFYAELSFLYTVSESFDAIGLFGYDASEAFLGGEYMFGVEGRVKAGGGYLTIAPQYTEGVGFSLPIGVRVNF